MQVPPRQLLGAQRFPSPQALPSAFVGVEQ
jgi:hypothetical protein